MVFAFLKSFLSRKKETSLTGNLYKQKTLILQNTSIYHKDTDILFKTSEKETPIKIPIKKLSKLQINTDPNISLDFIFNKEKYTFYILTSHPIQSLTLFYNNVYPLISNTPPIFHCSSVSYSTYDSLSSQFIVMDGNTSVTLIQENVQSFLRVENQNEILHFEQISSDTQFYMDKKLRTFVWSILKENNFYTFSLQFSENLSFLEFVSKYTNLNFKSEESEHIPEKYYQDVEFNYESESSFEDVDYQSDVFNYEESKNDEKEKNSVLALDNDRVFVGRGGSIGVFRKGNEGLEFKTNMKNVIGRESTDNRADVSKMLIYGDGSALICMDSTDQNKLMKVDLNRGSIVENWDCKRKINDFFDSKKQNNDETLIGVSDNSLFRVDPRTKELVIEGKSYKTKCGFECGVTTSKGDVVVGSEKGDVRLYDKIEKRAKSLLPGLGDKIVGVDVTRNGKFIICTCKSYLLLICLESGDYSKSIKEKPIPKRLGLKPEHLAYIQEEVNFTPAKFSTDNREESIVTSTGHYVIIWNLKDILKGRLFSYQIKKYGDTVVTDTFDIDNDENVIVALRNDVKIAKKENMKNFERVVRGGGMKKR
ncbi:vacuolar import and degradation protein 27 [Hamiltosporidium magnivora]|uniref:Vacuolar import and degradation protein 27 n=1 Tax=Hamiltosporidium magnivora TaxID=148818 RepID=A0A4Q9LJ85_9MICR|nr:vacuolar import and degradation protein 27 [Hamiltosporidium magnivora]